MSMVITNQHSALPQLIKGYYLTDKHLLPSRCRKSICWKHRPINLYLEWLMISHAIEFVQIDKHFVAVVVVIVVNGRQTKKLSVSERL